MGTKEGADDAQWCRVLDAAYHTQHLQFILSAESVAALDLYGTRSLLYNLLDALHRLSIELVFRQLMQSVGRVEDATTALCYLGIAQAPYLIYKLTLTTVGIDDMGVAVAERREEGAARGVERVPTLTLPMRGGR
jgi:hypothetical protein